MEKIKIDQEASVRNIRKLIEDLFPIHRTLVNEGYQKSLEILKDQLPFSTLEVASGTEVFDWVVPQSWNVERARITTTDGRILVDFDDHNLHLSAYSEEFNGSIKHQDLLQHLNYREDLPSAIPYNFHYYKPHWSFNISYEQFKQDFNEDEYLVEIKTRRYDDELRIAEYFIPGELEEEILITSYMCHPSMVNDNLSGVVVTTELFKYLAKAENLRYSYRLIIIPETIGGVSFLSQFPEKTEKVKGGFTIYCCGDGDQLHYKKTYAGDNYPDSIAEYAANQFFTSEARILPFWPGGSDERQFNSAGVRMPMGAITRTPAAVFKEYHTSLDNKELIKPETLVDTLTKVAKMINIMEVDKLFTNNYRGEPCFSRHNIAYPTFSDALSKSAAYIVKILANEVDGSNTLLEIAMKWELNIFDLAAVAAEFEKENLINQLK